MQAETFGTPIKAQMVQPGHVILFNYNGKMEYGFSARYSNDDEVFCVALTSKPPAWVDFKKNNQTALVFVDAVLVPSHDWSQIALSDHGMWSRPGTLIATVKDQFLVFKVDALGNFGKVSISTGIVALPDSVTEPLVCFESWGISLPTQQGHPHETLLKYPDNAKMALPKF